ncbi:LbtU family siderophore porin, partial [bacterium]|nr:LbtU family siderophore porin [bacterium]
MTFTKYTLIFFAIFCLLLPSAAFATDTEALERQVQELARQLQELQAQLTSQRQEIDENIQRISKHRRDLAGNREHLQEQQETLTKTRSDQEQLTHFADRLKLIGEHVKIGGLVEVEFGFSDDYEGNNESDIVLATVALDIDINLHKYIAAHILLLWEEDDTEPVDLDEGYIVLGNTEHFPLYLQVGKLYLPFGNFESHMISDPLTLELGETRETAAILGVDYKGLYASAYTFNGDIDESGDDNEIKCFGLAAGYAFENQNLGFDIGMGWINSVADSDTLGDFLPSQIEDYVCGLTAHAIFTWQGLTLIGEYLGATDKFEVNELEFKQSGAEPKTWNIEIGYTFDLADHET